MSPGPPERSQEREWEETCHICLALARRMTRDRHTAEDVAQEAALRAWRYRHRLREPNRRGSWLARIVRNEVLRERSRRRPEPAESVGAGEAAEDGMISSAAERIALQKAMGELERSDRLLLRLRYGEDLTQPAIARVLGMPEGTVKVRLHRLRAKLHRSLRDE